MFFAQVQLSNKFLTYKSQTNYNSIFYKLIFLNSYIFNFITRALKTLNKNTGFEAFSSLNLFRSLGCTNPNEKKILSTLVEDAWAVCNCSIILMVLMLILSNLFFFDFSTTQSPVTFDVTLLSTKSF